MALIAAPLINRKVNPYRIGNKPGREDYTGRRGGGSSSELPRISKTDDDLHCKHSRRHRDKIQTIGGSNLKASRKISVSHPDRLDKLDSDQNLLADRGRGNILADTGRRTAPIIRQSVDGSPIVRPVRKVKLQNSDSLQRRTKLRESKSPADLRAILEADSGSAPNRPRPHTESYVQRRSVTKWRSQRVGRHLSPAAAHRQPASLVMRKRSRSEHCISDEIRRQIIEEANRRSLSPESPTSGGNPFSKMWKNFRKMKIGKHEESPT